MGKYYDQLKSGDPNRKVSDQEVMNVIREFLEEHTAMMQEALNRMEPTMQKLKAYTEEAQKPKQRLGQRLLRAIRHFRGGQNAPEGSRLTSNTTSKEK